MERLRRYRPAYGHGFSVLELMLVVFIVAILVVVVEPMLRPPINAAKWAEARLAAGALAAGIRSYCVETGQGHDEVPFGGDFSDFLVYEVDLRGKYFTPGNYSVSKVTYNPETGKVTYEIRISVPEGLTGSERTLDQDGQWSDIR